MKPRNNPFHQTLDQRKLKFDPEKALKKIKEESATPWSSFKNEMIKAKNDELIYSNANASKIDVTGKNQLDKIRKQNHNKSLIEEKCKEPTRWEDFSSDPTNEIKNIKKNKKKKIKALQLQYADKELNVKNLTPAQNNFLRSKITRAVFHEKRSTFKSVVDSMKRFGTARINK